MQELTEEGKKVFAAFFKECCDRAGLTTQLQVSIYLSELTKKHFPEGQVRQLQKGNWGDKFDFNYLYALVMSGILKFAPEVEQGRVLDFNDVMAIFANELDPFTGKKRTNGSTAKTS